MNVQRNRGQGELPKSSKYKQGGGGGTNLWSFFNNIIIEYPLCTTNDVSILLLQNCGGYGIGRGWLIYIKVWVGGQGVGIIL